MITNEEYLKSNALSQSRLKKLLNHPQSFLKPYDDDDEPRDTTTIGDAVDLILTQGDEVFYDQFYITDVEKPTAMMGTFVWELYLHRNDTDAEQIAYNKSGFKIKLEKVKERFEIEGRGFYEALLEADGKSTITLNQKYKIDAIVDSLRTNPFTKDWIVGNDNLEIYKQVAIEFEYLDFPCKGLIDLIVVDRQRNVAHPIDIKTSSASTNGWVSMFWKFRYDIQAAFYSYGIKDSGLLEKLGCDLLMPFKFIVENQDFPGNPLIYQVSNEILEGGQFGGSYQGKSYEGFHQAITRYAWHTNNDMWSYPMQDYVNNGVRIIERI